VPAIATASPPAQDPGWLAEYYPNHDLAGPPVLTRYEPAIDYVWGTGSPTPAVPVDGFSVRWTRQMGFDAGTYSFCLTVDDGTRFWVDGQLLIDQWRVTGTPVTYCATPALTSGFHTLQMAYFEDTGNAVAKLAISGPLPNVPAPGPPVPWPPSPADAWIGEYYDDMFLGASTSPAKQPVMVRMDPQINFNWDNEAPSVGLRREEFSVRWTRDVNLPPGNYNFCATVDDGVRVWVDSELIMDEWREQSVRTFCSTRYMSAGHHTLQVAYLQKRGGAVISFSYSTGSVAPPPVPQPQPWPTVPVPQPQPWPTVPVPQPQPWPTVPVPQPQPWPTEIPQPWPPQPGTGWYGEYFGNTYFGAPPMLTRIDPDINFDWGWGAPAPGLPADNFSVRWTRDVYFDNGTYTFFARHDDGVRVYVDGSLVIDSWFDQSAIVHSGVKALNIGTHRVQVDYYEHTQAAVIMVWWTLSGYAPPEPPVPAPQPWPTAPAPQPWPTAPAPQPWPTAPAPQPWPTSPSPAPGPAAEAIVDNTDPGFVWGGSLSARNIAYLGVGGSLFWTYNSYTDPVNYGKWIPWLAAPGYYEVFAFIPREFATSTSVRYRIIHGYGQRDDRVISQARYSDQWVSLGIYPFSAAGNEFVLVYDNTREPYGATMIAFDAVKFVPRW
jgi:hypothetical protein